MFRQLRRCVKNKKVQLNLNFVARSSRFAKELGQPSYETRPHLIKPQELTPGIKAIEYFERRVKLAAKLPIGGIAIIIGNQLQFKSGAAFYEFEQDANFYYLTGFSEPNAVMVIEKVSENSGGTIFHLFVQPKNDSIELWEGTRTGIEGAKEIFNADESGDSNYLLRHLEPIIKRAKEVYIDFPIKHGNKESRFQNFIYGSTLNNLTHSSPLYNLLKIKKTRPLYNIVEQLRSIKSEDEIKVMQTACDISSNAFNEAVLKSSKKRFTKESELYAYIDYKMRINGCDKIGYIPVVAGGKNALQIHYTRNDDAFNNPETSGSNGDYMVLVDAGGQYGGYVADISRTWPIFGKWSEAQKDLYQAVLNVNKECIKLCTTNSQLSLNEIHWFSETLMLKELKNIGFIIDDINTLDRYLYLHHIGHYLGLQVHDTPSVSRSIKLVQNQVITIEPGIYIPENDTRWPKHFRGIGIRIEDDVVVKNDKPIVLSRAAKKEVNELGTF